MSEIPLHVAVEDALSEGVVRKLLQWSGRGFAVGQVFMRGGNGYLRTRAKNWNIAAASNLPFLLLTDLDTWKCAAELKSEWLEENTHPNLLFRVAVREVEAWLLGDATSLSKFLRCREHVIPDEPEIVERPKECLIEIARSAKASDHRTRLVPRPNSTAIQGPDYNGCLLEFVEQHWNPEKAADRCPSLKRTMKRIREFEPQWS